MNKRMCEVTVSTDNGLITISCPNPDECLPDNIIYISTDQADVLIKWIQEAKAELEQKQ